jgi:hypothetical protein
MKFPSRTYQRGQTSTIKNNKIINIGNIRLFESDVMEGSVDDEVKLFY